MISFKEEEVGASRKFTETKSNTEYSMEKEKVISLGIIKSRCSSAPEN